MSRVQAVQILWTIAIYGLPAAFIIWLAWRSDRSRDEKRRRGFEVQRKE